jgi:hypothetical protein
MRHLLLYEAFKSSGISKTLKFLSKNNVNKTEFLNVLKRVLKNYDYPISEFTDNDVHYMSAKKAKEIRIPSDYDIMNPWGIYSLRFWFSIADGYLGYSGIGTDLKSSLSEDELNLIEKSDFALVIYLDELIKYDSVKDIRLDREKSKSGATALLSDEDFKKINYDRYIHSLLIKKGIHKDSKYEDLKNLQNIISKFLLDNWILVTLHRSVPDYKYNIRRFVSYLEDLINSNDKESELEHLLRGYNKILKDCDHYKNRFVKSKKMVEEKGNDITNSMLNKWLDLSSYLSKKINSSPINNVDDIIVLLYKLNSISEYLNDDRVSLEGGLNGVLANFHYADSDVSTSAQRYNSASEELNKENLRRIDLVKRFIDKIL